MSVALSATGPVRCSDKNAALVALYSAIRAGWEPPDHVTREEYRAARELPDADPRKAFCGYGCSFRGKWFSGYTEPYSERTPMGSHTRRCRPHRAAAISVKQNVSKVRGPIEVLDFLAVEPRPIDAVIYCDPVYRGVTGYPEVGAFDHDLFLRRVRDWSGRIRGHGGSTGGTAAGCE
jgi:DNA adenine methylase